MVVDQFDVLLSHGRDAMDFGSLFHNGPLIRLLFATVWHYGMAARSTTILGPLSLHVAQGIYNGCGVSDSAAAQA